LSDTTILHAVSTLTTGHVPSKYISVCHSMSSKKNVTTIPRSPRSTDSIIKVALYFPNEMSQTRAPWSQYMYRTTIEPFGVRPDMKIQNTHVKWKPYGLGSGSYKTGQDSEICMRTLSETANLFHLKNTAERVPFVRVVTTWRVPPFTTLWPMMGTFCCICPVYMLPHPTILFACKTKF
jgi:hypothetical protein